MGSLDLLLIAACIIATDTHTTPSFQCCKLNSEDQVSHMHDVLSRNVINMCGCFLHLPTRKIGSRTLYFLSVVQQEGWLVIETSGQSIVKDQNELML